MSFNNEVPTSYMYEENGLIYEGKLPKSALEQFDVYAALLAYWESKTPKTLAVIRNYVVANTTVTEKSTKIVLKPEELNFYQIKLMFDKYLTMASEFFTSPQEK